MNDLQTETISPLQRWRPMLAVVWILAYWCLFFTSQLPNGSNSERSLYRSDVLFMLPEIYQELIAPPQTATTGWKFLSQRIAPGSTALFLIAASFATGALILRALRLMPALDLATQIALSGGLGFAAASLFTLGCGVIGLLSKPLFVCAMGVSIGLEGWLRLSQAKRKAATRSQAAQQKSTKQAKTSEPAKTPWLFWACLLISVPFLGCMFFGALLPPTDFDVKEYHLGGPKEYFLAGRIHFLPHDVYTSFPFLTEMLLLAGMVVWGDWQTGALVGQAVLAAFAPVTAAGVYCVARQLTGATSGLLAALIYLTIPWTYRISIIAYTEGALCCYVVLALLAFLLWRDGRGTERTEWKNSGPLLLGLLAGSAVATKYPGMILVAIPFAVAGFVTAIQTPGTTPRRVTLECLLYSAGVLITFGPWMLKNLLETGNPVYPLLYSVFGGIDWNAELQAKWKAAHPPLLLQPGWNDLRGVLFANDWQSPLLFGFAPLACLSAVRRRAVLEVAGYALFLLVAWYLFTHRLDRFWVPMNSVMAVLAGIGLWQALEWTRVAPAVEPLRKKGARPAVQPDQSSAVPKLFLRATLVSLVGLAVTYNFGFITTPLCGFNGYLIDLHAARELTETPSVTVAKKLDLPPGSKVLFIGEAALFDADFPYVYCTVFDQNLFELWTAEKTGPDSWQLRPREEILQDLRKQGITHLFVSWNEILRYRTTYGFTNYVTPERFRELEQLGIIKSIPLPVEAEFRRWENIDPAWQQEIERWAPELKETVHGTPAMTQFQAFRVNEEPSGSIPREQ